MNVEEDRIQILKEIQENCKRRHMCNGCEYYTDATSCGCIFRNIPSRWLLEQEEKYDKRRVD